MPDVFVSKKSEGKIPKHGHRPAVLDALTPSSRTMSAFCFKPKGIKFETRQKGEKVILLLRRHPVTNAGWVFVAFLLGIVPFFLQSFPIISFLPENFRLVAVMGWYLVIVAFSLENFLTWFFNVYIITDERIIDIDFYNLIYKEVTDANIDKIQDVTYRMGGVIRTIFNYGDVIIQTASEVPNLEALAVPKPALIAGVLQDLRIEEEVEKLEGRIR